MMGGIVGNAIGSITEGGGALMESVKHAVSGELGEAGKDMARAGLEAGGLAATFAGAGPAGEMAQEAIEGALDNAFLERGKGDVPGPGGGADFSIGNLFQGAVQGAVGGAGGGVFGGMAGGGGALGKVLGIASGGGGGGGGLQSMLGGLAGGGGGGGGLLGGLANLGQGTQLLNNLLGAQEAANGRVQSSAI